MKYRRGFVSNSSSTSFIVAFVPEENNLNLKTLDFLVTNMSSQYGIDLEVFRSTVKERRDTLTAELKTIMRDKEWLKDYVDKLSECALIPGIQLLMHELDESEDDVRKTGHIRYLRRAKRPWENIIIDHIHAYKGGIEDINRKIKEINQQLNLISNLSEESIVAAWKQSNGQTVLSNLVNILQEDGRIIVLERIIT